MEGKTSIERKTIKEHLIWLRDTYRDTIPAAIIHSNAPDNKYKIRKTWFIGVAMDMEAAVVIEKQIQDPEVVKEVERFIHYVRGEEFRLKPRTEVSDIEWANRIINTVIEKLP